MTDLAPPNPKIVRVVDVESSELPENEPHAIVEIGWVDLRLDDKSIRDPVTFLVNPGHPIPPHVRAIHHISDQMVADAMRPDQATALLMKGLGKDDVLCAHVAKFEAAFIGGDHRWICTYKVSLRAWPDLVSHSVQALRYALDLDADPDFDPAAASPPHRALPDAIVAAHLLRKELALRPLERLIEISGEPGFLTKIGGSKHRGKTFKEVAATDPQYLQWIVEKSDMDEDTKFTARWHLERRAAA
jgi:exodeoxyribonuclease X